MYEVGPCLHRMAHRDGEAPHLLRGVRLFSLFWALSGGLALNPVARPIRPQSHDIPGTVSCKATSRRQHAPNFLVHEGIVHHESVCNGEQDDGIVLSYKRLAHGD